jgi:NAD(P)H-hydrate repair Nnr-like enzyme with NAD(P)H-hydrate dehydratase domain
LFGREKEVESVMSYVEDSVKEQVPMVLDHDCLKRLKKLMISTSTIARLNIQAQYVFN